MILLALFIGQFLWQSQLKIYPDEVFNLDNIEGILGSEMVIKDRKGKEIGVLSSGTHRRFISLEAIPKSCREMLISAEDKNFFEHNGFSLKGFIRAMLFNLRNLRLKQGGSTLTMQTIEIVFGNNRTVWRKIHEIIAALRIERKYSKEKILEFYLNQFFVGANGRGIAIAARYFFNKKVEELNAVNCAFIAGSVQGPSTFNPFHHQNNKKKQQRRLKKIYKRVLYVLLRASVVYGQAYETLYQNLKSKGSVGFLDFLAENKSSFSKGSFRYKGKSIVGAVSDYLNKLLDENEELNQQASIPGSLEVETYVDIELQNYLDKALLKTLKHYKKFWPNSKNPLGGGAALVFKGQALAISSGPGQIGFNRALYGNRQFGSVMKVPTYAFRFSLGWSPFSLVDNRSHNLRFSNIYYRPRRAHKAEEGFLSSLEALGKSENSAAVNTLLSSVLLLPEEIRLFLWKKFMAQYKLKHLRDKLGILDINKYLKQDLLIREKLLDLKWRPNHKQTKAEALKERELFCKEKGLEDQKPRSSCKLWSELKNLRPYNPRRLVYQSTAIYILIHKMMKYFNQKIMGGESLVGDKLFPSWPLGADNQPFPKVLRFFESLLGGYFYVSKQPYPLLIKSLRKKGREIYRSSYAKKLNPLNKELSESIKSHLLYTFYHGTGRGIARRAGLTKNNKAFIGGKTGTTNDNRNSAFFAFIDPWLVSSLISKNKTNSTTEELIFGSYIGFDRPQPMQKKGLKVSGANGGGKVFEELLKMLSLKLEPCEELCTLIRGKKEKLTLSIDPFTGFTFESLEEDYPWYYRPPSLRDLAVIPELNFLPRFWQSSLWGYSPVVSELK